MKERKYKNFKSYFAIGDTVDFNSDALTMGGIIVAVRFTKAKVFYDIVEDYNGEVIKNVDSCDLIYPK